MRIVFIGCVQFSYTILEHILAFSPEGTSIVGIVTKKQSKMNSDFASLEPIARKGNISVFFYDQQPEATSKWIEAKQPDVIYCFGWSHILPDEILNIPRIGVIGYHPAELPYNRGRHPIIWSLVLGLKRTASTFFLMDAGVDSGDIISQEMVEIDPSDDANTLYRKLILTAQKQVVTLTRQLKNKTYKRVPQNHSIANYWRKRTKQDGLIDWRMGAEQIYNLTRALTRPYPGAHCVYRDREVKIWKVAVLKDRTMDHLEPGKVVRIEDSHIHVKCGTDLIIILEHEFTTMPRLGEYL